MITETEYRKANPDKLRIYDIVTDNFRDVTQKDIDDYGALLRAYGRIRQAAREAHDQLVDSTKR